MSPSTSYGKREPLRILDHNQSSASAQEINKNNKSILHYETPIAGPLPSPSPPPPPSPSQSQSQYFAEATTKATAIVGAASTISVIAAPFCSDSDAYIQAFKNSRYLHSNIFFGKESLKQYCRVDGQFTTPTKNQACRPFYLDDRNNACIIFSCHRTNKARQSNVSTGQLQMYKSELQTAMLVSRKVWLDQKAQGVEDHHNLRMCHISATMDDIWVLQYYWTADLYEEVQRTGSCNAECVMSSFRRDSAPWRAPINWVQDYIDDEMEMDIEN